MEILGDYGTSLLRLLPPEGAHEVATWLSKFPGISKLLDEKSHPNSTIEISNAAGFNKNGKFSTELLRAMGFTRNLVGTVTADPWQGNPKPRIKRLEGGSMLNWMGLPGEGVDAVRKNVSAYGQFLDLTTNFMATPGKEGADILTDLKKTVRIVSDFSTRLELNISCPNTAHSQRDYLIMLDAMLDTVNQQGRSRPLYVKLSPDTSLDELPSILEKLQRNHVRGVTLTNTSTQHGYERGGLSGRALYPIAKRFQEKVLSLDEAQGLEVIAVGGIDSVETATERTNTPAVKGIQIYTGLVTKGPSLIRELRRNYAA